MENPPTWTSGEQPPALQPFPAPQPRNNRVVVALVVVAIVAAAGIASTVTLLVARSGTGAPKTNPKDFAILACEDSLRSTLKSPSTAKFSNENAVASGSQYTVTGAVDAQNGFGAMLRRQWSCTASGSGSSWTGNARLTDDN